MIELPIATTQLGKDFISLVTSIDPKTHITLG